MGTTLRRSGAPNHLKDAISEDAYFFSNVPIFTTALVHFTEHHLTEIRELTLDSWGYENVGGFCFSYNQEEVGNGDSDSEDEDSDSDCPEGAFVQGASKISCKSFRPSVRPRPRPRHFWTTFFEFKR